MTTNPEGQPPSRTRRWLRRAAGLMVVVVIGWSAWEFRPLNSTERRLVGLWRTPGPGAPKQEIVFTPDRRFVAMNAYDIDLHGTWSCSGEKLRCVLNWNPTPSFRIGFWQELQILTRRIWATGGRRPKWPVSIVDDNHLDHDGEVLARTKVLSATAE